ncbi:MAG: hypothetical protein ACRDXX_22430 [Stackebrandtia sp.]
MTDTKRVSKNQTAKDGYLPITELTSPMAAAGSPFGDDLTFPLPVDRIDYSHSEPQPPRIDRED